MNTRLSKAMEAGHKVWLLCMVPTSLGVSGVAGKKNWEGHLDPPIIRSLFLPPLHPFCPCLCSPPTVISFFSVLIGLFLLFCLFSSFIFLDSTYKWNYMVFFFPWPILLSIIASRSIHIVEKGKISFFLMTELCYAVCRGVCVCITSLFIGQWALRLLPYLGFCKYCHN